MLQQMSKHMYYNTIWQKLKHILFQVWSQTCHFLVPISVHRSQVLAPKELKPQTRVGPPTKDGAIGGFLPKTAHDFRSLVGRPWKMEGYELKKQVFLEETAACWRPLPLLFYDFSLGRHGLSWSQEERPVMNLVTSKNFIVANAVEVILAAPKKRLGEKHCLEHYYMIYMFI